MVYLIHLDYVLMRLFASEYFDINLISELVTLTLRTVTLSNALLIPCLF